ncbi:sensor domain-containing diguanylate cyclase [Vibrio variabilis]|uniref:sensor domain-containing diguanylate cyclase n=1 Tax=Vibrio variabilis TaxID=990271 RepID=UPI000DD9EBFA|nr:sensor domain-containing diguanylate cyclase [Vibrio variabilis]
MNEKVGVFQQETMLLGLCLIPLFLFFNTVTIITLRKQAISINELTAIFNSSSDGIIYVNASGKICKANNVALKIFGYTSREFRRLEIEDLLDSALRSKHRVLRSGFMSEEQSRSLNGSDSKVHGVKKDGSKVELSIAITAKKLGNEMIGICVIKDLTAINTLQQHSESDHLTEISNRRHFDYILNKELNRVLRNQREASLLLIDIDNFKQLNDGYGHLAGDKALKQVAEFLVLQSRESDYVCRWGGDEFAIFCPELLSTEAVIFAERLRKSFETLTENDEHPLTLSIGIAGTSLVQPLTSINLLDSADKAVYQAKQMGKNQVVNFQDIFDAKVEMSNI